MLEIKDRLKTLRNGLLRLHKSLLDSERAAYEHDIARITSTGQYLGLVLNDPWFHWLHELSQFIVLIDETLDFLKARYDALFARRPTRFLLCLDLDAKLFEQRSRRRPRQPTSIISIF